MITRIPSFTLTSSEYERLAARDPLGDAVDTLRGLCCGEEVTSRLLPKCTDGLVGTFAAQITADLEAAVKQKQVWCGLFLRCFCGPCGLPCS